jgi:hypothetical protein
MKKYSALWKKRKKKNLPVESLEIKKKGKERAKVVGKASRDTGKT